MARPTHTPAGSSTSFDRELRHLIDLWLTREELRVHHGALADRANVSGQLHAQRAKLAQLRREVHS